MTVLEAMLRGIRSHDSALSHVEVEPGGELTVRGDDPLVLCGVVAGELVVAGTPLAAGGVAMLRGGPGVALPAGAAGASVLVCRYRTRDGGAGPTEALPPVAAVPAEAPDCVTLLRLLASPLGDGGTGVVRDRMLDWLLTCTLDAWFAAGGPERAGWSAALADRVVGPALAALHAEPSRRWTVAELAAHSGGAGRATFAKRFREVVGCAPLAYLRGWRMTLAAEYLSDPDVTVAAVARRVGYADAFTFSAAFKRERGVAPSAVRS